jgi:hypothetical protein
MAEVFVGLVREHLLGALAGDRPLPPGEAAHLTERIQRVRPLARTVADAQFALAMDRRVHAEYDEVLRQRRHEGAEDPPDAEA